MTRRHYSLHLGEDEVTVIIRGLELLEAQSQAAIAAGDYCPATFNLDVIPEILENIAANRYPKKDFDPATDFDDGHLVMPEGSFLAYRRLKLPGVQARARELLVADGHGDPGEPYPIADSPRIKWSKYVLQAMEQLGLTDADLSGGASL